jgi:hypothetical protein
MLRGVAEKDAPIGAGRGKHMVSDGREVGVAGTLKDHKVGVRGSSDEEGEVE